MFYLNKNDRWAYLFTFLYFLLLVPIGTLLHEVGHSLAGQLVGLHTHIHYAYTTCDEDYKTFSFYQQLALLIGGPLCTIVVAHFGLCLVLFSNTKNIFLQIIYLGIAFFMSREIMIITQVLKILPSTFHAIQSDEFRIAQLFHFPFLLPIIAVYSTCFLLFTAWRAKLPFTYFVFAFLGCVFGALGWLVFWGKVVMP